MAGENTLSTLNGLFKVQYADKLLDLLPDFAILQKRIEFCDSDKESGNYYAQPVALSSESGFTYNGEAGAVVALNAAVNGTMKEAQVKGTEIILSSKLAYTALSRASNSVKAFKKASGWKVMDMNNAARRRLEISMLYGQQSIGEVLSNTSGALVLTEASWAGGIWAGAEGTIINAYTSNAASATLRNGDLTISAVDSDLRTVTVTGTSTAVVQGDFLYFKGSRTTTAHNDMAGLQKIISNTGTLFNIDASLFSLFRGNVSSSVGQISHAKLQTAISKAVNKGLMEKVLVLVSPKAWGVLNSDQAALRVFDSSYGSKKGENGFESLSFHSTNGVCEIVAHPMVKDGDAFILPEDSILRLGSVDLSFGVPGMEEEFFRMVDGYNAVELQCMADQAVFIERPAHAVYMSGITYA